jgi:nitroimidazol reductase NimA-like FMN-containing flavoprotein (pyridoxamine 5'-phosphate oxidase superfamily)
MTVRDVLTDPLAQELMDSAIPARLAYEATDGTPRVVPIGFWWNGQEFFVATIPFAPKVAALRRKPAVALTIDTNEFPPHVLLVRGTARVTIVDGVPAEYLAASRKFVSPEQWPDFEAGARALYDEMALIAITPTWAKVMDFETRLPEAVSRLAESKK